jgi:hypothetical protein
VDFLDITKGIYEKPMANINGKRLEVLPLTAWWHTPVIPATWKVEMR